MASTLINFNSDPALKLWGGQRDQANKELVAMKTRIPEIQVQIKALEPQVILCRQKLESRKETRLGCLVAYLEEKKGLLGLIHSLFQRIWNAYATETKEQFLLKTELRTSEAELRMNRSHLYQLGNAKIDKELFIKQIDHKINARQQVVASFPLRSADF